MEYCKNCGEVCQFPCAKCGSCTMFFVLYDGENKCMDCAAIAYPSAGKEDVRNASKG